MYHLLLDIGVPIALFLLMLISGTEIDLKELTLHEGFRKLILVAITIQLIAVPLLTFAILKMFFFDSRIASCLILLTLCPGGGISNYYTYIAKRDVFLSASITSLGTLLSLFTIPLWLFFLHSFFSLDGIAPTLPTVRILSSLVFFIIIPLGLGCALKYLKPVFVSKMKVSAQIFSLILIFLILFLNVYYFSEEVRPIYFSVLSHATSFILGSMCLSWSLTRHLPNPSRPVLVIESAVRNVSIALILGRILFPSEMFAIQTSFLIWYFIVEICVMLIYASYVRMQSI